MDSLDACSEVSITRVSGRIKHSTTLVESLDPPAHAGVTDLIPATMDSSATQKPNLRTEAIAGVTTFFTMAYIVIVNPQILSAGGKTGMVFSGVLTATVLICFTMTLLMGVYAHLPFAVAPGMG